MEVSIREDLDMCRSGYVRIWICGGLDMFGSGYMRIWICEDLDMCEDWDTGEDLDL